MIFTRILVFYAVSIVVAMNHCDNKRYVILDNDWETTGFVPLLTVLQGGMDVLGLTSGDTWQRQCALHAVATLELGNLNCLSVYEGASVPFLNSEERVKAWEMVHGPITYIGALRPQNVTAEAAGADPTGGSPERINQLAFPEGFPVRRPNASTNAVDFLIKTVKAHPGCVSIFTAGPLTNIALAIRTDPSFAASTKEIILMGGMVDKFLVGASGSLFDAQIYSDTNLLIDPEAAKITLNAEFPNITIVGNAASQIIATQTFADQVFEVKNNFTRLFHKYFNKGYPLWDETASAVLADPSVVSKSTKVYIDVDTAYGSQTYGSLRVYRDDLRPFGSRQATYVLSVDENRVLDMIKKGMQNPASCKA